MFGFKNKKEENNNQKYNPNEACMTCSHILEENKPILYMKRDVEDGGYQFLCGEDNHTEAEARVVGIGEIVKIDGRIGATLPLSLGQKIEILPGNNGKGLELKKFIKNGINNVIQKDISDGKVSMEQLYNNGEITYYNGRNGTWFDWDVNGKTSWFTVCFNDKKRMGYISVAINKDGTVSGYKWGNYGKDESESIKLGSLSEEDVNYFVRLLLQQTDDKGIFNVSIESESIDWEAPVVLESLEGTEDPEAIP